MKDQDRAEIEAQGALGYGADEDELRGPFMIGDYKRLKEECDGLERYVDLLRQRQREIQDRCICDDEEHDRSDARFARLIEKHKTKEAFLFNQIRNREGEANALRKAVHELTMLESGRQKHEDEREKALHARVRSQIRGKSFRIERVLREERDELLKANAELQSLVDDLERQIKDMQYSIGTAIALSTPMPSNMSNGM